MLNEIKIALRGLLKTPGFTAIALVTIALAIGANTAVFSLINGLLVKPLPYSDPVKLVLLWEKFAAQGLERIPVSAPEFLDLEKEAQSYSRIAAFDYRTFNMSGSDLPERISGGRSYIVIGVMPASFEFPIPLFNVQGGQFAERVDVWKPAAFTPIEMQTRYSRSYGVIARLRPDVTPERAQAELNTIMANWIRIHPDLYSATQGFGAKVYPLHDQVVGGMRKGLMILLGSVAGVLLNACANLATMLLSCRRGLVDLGTRSARQKWRAHRSPSRGSECRHCSAVGDRSGSDRDRNSFWVGSSLRQRQAGID